MLTRIASFLFVANTVTLAVSTTASTLSSEISQVKAPYNKYAELLIQHSNTSFWSSYLFGQNTINDEFARNKSRLGQTNS